MICRYKDLIAIINKIIWTLTKRKFPIMNKLMKRKKIKTMKNCTAFMEQMKQKAYLILKTKSINQLKKTIFYQIDCSLITSKDNSHLISWTKINVEMTLTNKIIIQINYFLLFKIITNQFHKVNQSIQVITTVKSPIFSKMHKKRLVHQIFSKSLRIITKFNWNRVNTVKNWLKGKKAWKSKIMEI